MNWRRGILRIWVVLTGALALFALFISPGAAFAVIVGSATALLMLQVLLISADRTSEYIKESAPFEDDLPVAHDWGAIAMLLGVFYVLLALALVIGDASADNIAVLLILPIILALSSRAIVLLIRYPIGTVKTGLFFVKTLLAVVLYPITAPIKWISRGFTQD